ncbi:FAD-dependent oxidoreductase [Filimonas effusa]|uniref:FAD-dependent oxidoreductase n=1 Tax=Filimonas effusa TaxID=2508721 RepID=A0A4V1MAS7_9BACT|nr:FAD-dependent oxidoreductase [Filimonas effusa]RXK86916.1 FAD-dependent oxidoreductase [Filimonas effusa]
MINRDGASTSLWQHTIEPYFPVNPVNDNVIFDCIITGGGITGLSTALLLQEQGLKCLVIEAANIGFGTTGGTTAHLNTLLDTPYTVISKNFGEEASRNIAAAVKTAIDLIKTNIARYHISCGFEDADAFLFAQDEEQEKELQDIKKASADAGLSIHDTNAIPVPLPFVAAIKVAGQAKFNPLEYVFGLAKAFEEAGGIILQDTRVTGVVSGSPLVVNTGRGDFTAGHLIYATHIPPGVNLLHLRCVPYRSYAIAATLEDGTYPNDLSYDMYDPYHYYRTQHVNGHDYLIAGGEDHGTGKEEDTNRCLLHLESHIRKHFKVKEINYRWSSQYFEPADGLPYIGYLPGQQDNIYVATGYGGNGMVYSHVAAQLLKGIIMGEKPALERLLDPNRIKPVAGFTNFVSHNADVVKLFLGKLFSGEKISQLAELAHGEAKIVKYEDHKIALYKNENGALHAISPVCTHMKCEVQWNTAEKSWDCPCHGARYDFNGKAITGPADLDLEKLSLD